MDISQLPDVSGLLVTADNPARGDLLGMDHARCAALHNYLLHYAWLAERRPPASLHSNTNTFFTAYGAAAELLRPRLDPSLAAFLASAMLPPDGFERAPFFFWANEISDPDFLIDPGAADLYDEPVDSLVCLYSTNIGQGGESGGGLFYHQGYHRAAVFMHMDDYDYALPVKTHQELWHPLETVLSNWIELIRLGKVTASPREAPALFDSEKIGPWEWRPYGEAQIATCIDAWDWLCKAIEARISSPPPVANPEPLLTPAVLDAASVPDNCFARAFLTGARRPQFRYIAPGLLLPPTDTSEFTAVQPFTRLPRGRHTIPPVCLFPATGGESEVDLTGTPNSLYNGADLSVLSRVAAGIYSESVERSSYDNAEEGFRMLLPYGFKGDWDASVGARKSDGSFVGKDKVTELFQHGYKQFGGDYYRPQRLERLFDCWRKLVDEGVWSVGQQGVEGTVDNFKEADTELWKDYLISPTW
ncbi:hypothetical protein ACHAQJ_006506 [Trichoderma viride]